ncbi:MAG: hypothetical protein J5719_02175 [Bacteroidales bacterium]|nr:hypothetical protein [Bacteroidales bacterium]
MCPRRIPVMFHCTIQPAPRGERWAFPTMGSGRYAPSPMATKPLPLKGYVL